MFFNRTKEQINDSKLLRLKLTRFYTLIGEVVMIFNGLEKTLCDVYCCSLSHFDSHSKYYDTARASFHAIGNFENKLRLVNSAVKQNRLGDDTTMQEWNNLFNRIKRCQESRNKITHANLCGTSQNLSLHQSLNDPSATIKKIYGGKNSTLQIHDIKRIKRNIKNVINDLSNFNYKLWEQGEPTSLSQKLKDDKKISNKPISL